MICRLPVAAPGPKSCNCRSLVATMQALKVCRQQRVWQAGVRCSAQPVLAAGAQSALEFPHLQMRVAASARCAAVKPFTRVATVEVRCERLSLGNLSPSEGSHRNKTRKGRGYAAGQVRMGLGGALGTMQGPWWLWT